MAEIVIEISVVQYGEDGRETAIYRATLSNAERECYPVKVANFLGTAIRDHLDRVCKVAEAKSLKLERAG